ncbi:MAG: ABC-F family ATP-binding cassette domain-containing protein [Actinomycetaceae bacterium]|nr:ABC-F family ATP-binding cassette domain-containing protein [Actinomycetaceae bacterium]
MAHLFSLQHASVSRGGRPIFADVSLSCSDGDRIGIVGPNGGGKSTLINMIASSMIDEGECVRARDARIAIMKQDNELAKHVSVVDFLYGDVKQHEWARDSHIRHLHEGLLADIALETPVEQLSGGQKRRVALVKTLCEDTNVVILDEPTNHLDVEGITFLASYLKERFAKKTRGALLVVTHDRWFLDAVCEKVWEVVPCVDLEGYTPRPGRVEEYEGGYAAYILQRAERERLAGLERAKRNNILRKELAWLRRGAPARTSKPRFRVEAAEALIENVPPPRNNVELVALASSRLGKDVIDLLNVSFSYGDHVIFDDLTLRLAPGERIGIVGGNGMGKSTLISLMCGDMQPCKGKVKCGSTVKVGVLSQETHELDELSEQTVETAVSGVAMRITAGGRDITASQLIERLGFDKKRRFTRIKDLSGGERRRVQFMRILMGEVNVLILDEPTNDLDTDVLASMEDVLDVWPGTLVVVSHDRYFLERTTDHQVAIWGKSVRDLPRGIDEYMELVSAQKSVSAASGRNEEKGKTSSAKERDNKKKLGRLERKISQLNAKKDIYVGQQLKASEEGNIDELVELSKKISHMDEEIAALEEEWLESACDE